MKRIQRKEAIPREIIKLSIRVLYMVLPNSAVSGLPGCPDLDHTFLPGSLACLSSVNGRFWSTREILVLPRDFQMSFMAPSLWIGAWVLIK